MAGEKDLELSDEDKAVIEKYKESQKTAGKTDENDPEKELSRSEKRFQKLSNEKNELRDLADNQKAIIAQLKSEEQERVNKAKLDDGDFKGVIDDFKNQVASLEANLNDSKLDLLRYRIGIEEGLPPVIAALLRGENQEAIRAHALNLKTELPKPNSFSDGRQSSAPTINKTQGTDRQGKYQEISADVI